MASIPDVHPANNPGCVVFIAAADRGHFSWTLSLAAQLKQMGFTCELWTHQLAVNWTKDTNVFNNIFPVLGDGKEFHSCVASYKWASSYGDSDVDGAANVCANNCAGLKSSATRFGLSSFPTNFSSFFSQEGKQQLLNRFTFTSSQHQVVACVWERVWCDWVVPLCVEKDIPNLGIMPSFLHVYRGNTKPYKKFWWFDNEERERNLSSDIDPPLPDKDTQMCYILSSVLRHGIELPIGRKAYGPLLLPFISYPNFKNTNQNSNQDQTSTKKSLSSNDHINLSIEEDDDDDDLFSWIEDESYDSILLVSLGSQSCLSSLGKNATSLLLRGCLLNSSLKVLAVGMEINSLVTKDNNSDSKNSHEHTNKKRRNDEEACNLIDDNLDNQSIIIECLKQNRLRCEVSIDQWAILNHPKLQQNGCFLTHCGANSVHEALACGVRMCPFPFFDDQYYIAERIIGLYHSTDISVSEPCHELSTQSDDGILIHRSKPIYQITKSLVRNKENIGEFEKNEIVANISLAIEQALAVSSSKVSKLQSHVLKENGSSELAKFVQEMALNN